MAKKKTKKNVPVYLLVVDDTEEFQVALRYTAGMAKANDARISLLHVMDREDFQHWGTIEERMHEEYLKEAEGLLTSSADVIREISGECPGFYLEEGGRLDVILEIIQNDLSITKFILGGSTKSNNPGPLVSYFTSKGLSNLRVPLTIVPDSIEMPELD